MAEPHALLSTEPEESARSLLARCCGSQRWVSLMIAARPFASHAALLESAERCFAELDEDDYLEAFAHHPRIGEDLASLRARFASTAQLASAEQAGAQGASE